MSARHSYVTTKFIQWVEDERGETLRYPDAWAMIMAPMTLRDDEREAVERFNTEFDEGLESLMLDRKLHSQLDGDDA